MKVFKYRGFGVRTSNYVRYFFFSCYFCTLLCLISCKRCIASRTGIPNPCLYKLIEFHPDQTIKRPHFCSGYREGKVHLQLYGLYPVDYTERYPRSTMIFYSEVWMSNVCSFHDWKKTWIMQGSTKRTFPENVWTCENDLHHFLCLADTFVFNSKCKLIFVVMSYYVKIRA